MSESSRWLGMPAEWDITIAFPIVKGRSDIRHCSCCRAMKLFEHEMKVVERVLEKRLCRIVIDNEMQIGLMPERGKIDAVFILRRLQEEYHDKRKKLYMCFLDLEKAFDRAPRKVFALVMRKKTIPEVSVRSLMSLYEGEKTKFRVDSELSEKFEAKVESAPRICVDTFSSCNGDRCCHCCETMEGLRNKLTK